ncbi:3-ketoacyl-ACP reductase [Mycobacteroides abscessus subsp. abscessus]|nr:3-ketoacyl-ACP reductase [Mycobacteroides abscessus subsp. abscessus]
MRDHDVDVLELVLGLTRTPAMARAGLKMDTPGLLVSEPRDVAAQGLANLANGPVVVVKQFEDVAEKNSGHNRAELLLASRAAAKKLLPPPSR